MKISGNTCVNASADAIWSVLFNPSALLQLIPGCQEVEQVAPDQYRAKVTIHVPALSGEYGIAIKLVESEAYRFCRLVGSASGPSGNMQGSGTFSIVPQGKQTRIDYDSEVQICGPLAGLHPRFVEGVAQMLIRDWLARLSKLTEPTRTQQ